MTFVPWDPLKEMGAAAPTLFVAAVLLLVGGALVFWGWRVYRVALVLIGAALGALVGVCLAPALGVSAIFAAVPLAILCGFLAILAQDIGVFLLGGLWAAYLVLNAPGAMGTPALRYTLVGLTFLVVGLLAVLLWRPMITFLMAMFGAGLMARAVAYGADQFKPDAAEAWARAHPWAVFLALVVAAAIGVYFQEEGSGEKGKGSC